jgi:hypothetical protein
LATLLLHISDELLAGDLPIGNIEALCDSIKKALPAIIGSRPDPDLLAPGKPVEHLIGIAAEASPTTPSSAAAASRSLSERRHRSKKKDGKSNQQSNLVPHAIGSPAKTNSLAREL